MIIPRDELKRLSKAERAAWETYHSLAHGVHETATSEAVLRERERWISCLAELAGFVARELSYE